MSHGFKGKIKETITTLDKFRKEGVGQRDITLREFIPRNFSENGNPLTIEHMFAELKIDPRTTTVMQVMDDDDTAYLMAEIVREGVRRGLGMAQREQLATVREKLTSQSPVVSDGGNQRFMSPEVFLDPLRLGAVQSAFYPDLIVREEPIPQPTATIPSIDLADAALKDSAEGATIEEGTVTYGSKDVKVTKKARGIGITYEAIKFNSLSLVQIFFEDAGRILGHTLNAMAVDGIVNGPYVGGTQAAAVVGVEDTNAGITWYDLARVAIQFGLIGRTAIQAIGNATTGLNYLDLDEVKLKQFAGAPLLGTVLRSPFTLPEQLFISPNVPANQLILQDPSMSLVQLTAIPLMVETEKIVSKQIEKSYASIMTGFAKLMRDASVILDGSIAYAGNGFPSWMQPYSE
jgi:hypothetical protein